MDNSPRTPNRSHSGRGTQFWIGLAVAVLVVYGFILLVRQSRPRQGAEHPDAGKQLVAFEVRPLTDGEMAEESVTLDDLAGKVVLINLWGTWCPPCVVELPHIAEIHRHYADRDDFRLLAVSCGPQMDDDAQISGTTADTVAFLDRAQLTLPVYLDPNATARIGVHQSIELQAFPTTLVLDGSGTIRGVWEGYSPGVEREMDRLVGRLLEGS